VAKSISEDQMLVRREQWSAMHVIVMLLHGLGWLAFWLLAVLVVLLVFGLAVGLVAWMIDRLTFDDKLRERPDRIRREL
jgi:hypothetical protein